jgi:hypothetical protein
MAWGEAHGFFMHRLAATVRLARMGALHGLLHRWNPERFFAKRKLVFAM